ncbi:hypothetical protein [Haloplasma contractile]|uniref:Uncharacterized protein n=1 Tax=Haloplasma contractile SSD-17B TaxID=1033810 RepID=U2FHI5_9MOLU|nr:hypothetical protein [Haloplasma contractile]ERJ12300.1 hypothetical protein HLPCO_001827 [Haloplasma contractile SSD-17B]
MKRTSIQLNQKSMDILNQYKSFGFTTKNDLIEKAVTDMILQQNYQYVSNSIVEEFYNSFKEEFHTHLKTLKYILNENNRQIIKNKLIFANEVLDINNSGQPCEEVLAYSYKKARSIIDADSDNVEKILKGDKNA